MNKHLISFIVLLLHMFPLAVYAKDSQLNETIELAKNAIPEKRKAYIASIIKLDNKEAEVFWRIYDAYTTDMSPIIDQSYGLVDQYAKAYRENTISDDLAARLMNKHFKLKTQKNKITQKYLKKISHAFSDRLAMRFLQAEEKMDTIIKYAYQFDVPLIEFN